MIAFLICALAMSDLEAYQPVSFATDVQPILTKLGCNQGSCHGSQFGKGGFKLSLRGFDDPADYFEIARGAKGRRLSISDPTLSLLLAKPTLALPHKGGKKLDVGSSDYETILQWISQGAPAPRAKEPHLERLVVEPQHQVLTAGAKVSIKATVYFDDGRSEVVTERATFDSASPGVASVDSNGVATVVGKGEAAIMVRFLDRVAVCRLTVPYRENVPATEYQHFSPRNSIDEHLLAKWQQLGLVPTKDCTDVEFLRRVYFDCIGTPPTREEVEKFVADPSPTKRERVIDSLLERTEYVDYWTSKWGDLLRNNRNLLQEKGMWAFRVWIAGSIRDNKPIDQFVSEMITATGSPFQEGAANFYRVGRKAEEWAENTAQVFLGVRMQCAQCHHHPFENLSQADYYGMTAFFSRVANKQSEEFGIQGRDAVVYVREAGEARHPRTGQIMPPTPLGDKPIAKENLDPVDRRRSLAQWLSDRKNPALAKNVVNRYWGYFFGRGLVHPIDDIRVTNPAACTELFDVLAADLIEHKYDVKHLLRQMMNSRVYQLSAIADPKSEVDAENRYFTHYSIKRLSAEQLLDSIDNACGTQERYNGLPEGYRAVSLPDTNVASRFLDTFGRPRREIACECERTDSPNMTQALQLLTGRLINTKVQANNGRVAVLIKNKVPTADAVRELYFAVYHRPPDARELNDSVGLVQKAPTTKEGLEDLLWAMLNTREFQFNH